MRLAICINTLFSMQYRGGEGGIRTLGRALEPYDGLANRCLQPLGHLSAIRLNALIIAGPSNHPLCEARGIDQPHLSLRSTIERHRGPATDRRMGGGQQPKPDKTGVSLGTGPNQGKTAVQLWFAQQDGKRRAAYFASVER